MAVAKKIVRTEDHTGYLPLDYPPFVEGLSPG
jgi:hypothetical protein